MATELGPEQHRGLLSQFQHYLVCPPEMEMGFPLFWLAVVFSVMLSASVKPVYTASGSIWIEDDPNILPFEDVQSFAPIPAFRATLGFSRAGRWLRIRSRSSSCTRIRISRRMPAKTDTSRMPEDPILRGATRAGVLEQRDGHGERQDASRGRPILQRQPSARGRYSERSYRRLRQDDHQEEVRGV